MLLLSIMGRRCTLLLITLLLSMLLLFLLTLDSFSIVLATDFRVVADNVVDDIAIIVDDDVAAIVDSNNIVLIVVEWQITTNY